MAKILVAEDDTAVRVLLARILARAGYHVTLAASVSDARREFLTSMFDLVISDNDCPQLNSGRDWLKELPPTQKSILISGKDVWDIGELPYITKPFSVQLLLKVVAETLDE